MVMQIHEKNLVLINIRHIAENETAGDLRADASDEVVNRAFADTAVRRKEILGEILPFLRHEDKAKRVRPKMPSLSIKLPCQ